MSNADGSVLEIQTAGGAQRFDLAEALVKAFYGKAGSGRSGHNGLTKCP